MTVAGPERHDGEAPYTYVVHAADEPTARALVLTYHAASNELRMTEVRIDTGKFINSTWSLIVCGVSWWVVIGLHDTVETIIRADKAVAEYPARGAKPGQGQALRCTASRTHRSRRQ